MLATFLVLAAQATTRIRLEAENGTLTGPVVAREGSGFSGDGYVTGFTHGNDWVQWRTPELRAGVYAVTLGYRAPGPKGFELEAAGHGQSGMFTGTGDRFATASAGRVELNQGVNEIRVGKGWGYYDIDFIELTPSTAYPSPKKPPLKLADPQASPATRDLMRRLIATYGERTWTGQYEEADTNWVKAKVGVSPAIWGGDLMDYSPSRVEHGADAKDGVGKMIAESNKGAAITLSWHWNAPAGLLDRKERDAKGNEVDLSWYKGFYTQATTFDIAKAMSDTNSTEYRLLLRDIDAIAVQLRKFSDRDIPVLWRPLHEAEGGWFWWGAKGPEPQKKLWRLLFDRLTRHHRLHNLIWVYNSVDPAWYPGDDVVDIVSVDRYPADRTDVLTTDWEALQKRFDGRKLLTIAEFPGAPDVERMHRLGTHWAYFVSWTGSLGARGTEPSLLERTYRSPLSVNRGGRAD